MAKTTTTIKSITELFAKETELELKDIDGNLTGIKLKVVGTDSKQFREAEKKTLPYFGKAKSDLTIDELMELTEINKAAIISLIVGWDNNDVFGGEYTPELAKAIFEQEQARIVLEQVEAFANVRANFFRGSKK